MAQTTKDKQATLSARGGGACCAQLRRLQSEGCVGRQLAQRLRVPNSGLAITQPDPGVNEQVVLETRQGMDDRNTCLLGTRA